MNLVPINALDSSDASAENGAVPYQIPHPYFSTNETILIISLLKKTIRRSGKLGDKS